ncbi:vitamin K epoxide reductase family protein, partial [Candidatus Uhrbacteria bacterium]|nr:vitamin K epoxide reductase family protein [Candidatus Uhrbacteria bacterium]
YALWQHYAPLGSAFCNLGETFSCDIVNKSAFSEVFGIPVALLGVLGYVGIGSLALGALVDTAQRARLLPVLLTVSLIGLVFSLYLTYIELFVIGAVCILCVTSQALILAITALAGIVWRGGRNVTYGQVGTTTTRD